MQYAGLAASVLSSEDEMLSHGLGKGYVDVAKVPHVIYTDVGDEYVFHWQPPKACVSLQSIVTRGASLSARNAM